MHAFHVAILLCNCIGIISATYCNDSLGMSNGKIKDSQIKQRDGYASLGTDARLNGGKGWCVDNIGQGFLEGRYLEIDLLQIHRIVGLLIKGGAGRGFKDYKAGKKMRLSSKINSKDSYSFVEDVTSREGSPSEVEYIKLSQPLDTRYIKYQPYTDENAKCVRLELLGCPLPKPTCRREVLTSSMSYCASSVKMTGQSKMAAQYIVKGSHFAWGPDITKSISSPYDQYVEIDLQDVFLITGVQTYDAYYSRTKLKQPPIFIILFKIKGATWTFYTGKTDVQYEFDTTKTLRSIIEIKPAIAARYIQVRPKIVTGSYNVYLKMQFFGCPLKDAFNPKKTTNVPTTKAVTKPATKPATKPIRPSKKIPSIAPTQKRLPEAVIKSYDIRQGSRFNDYSYKGSLAKGVLHGGKGSLTDGVISSKSPFAQPRLWVGWDKHLLSHPYIIINFQEFSTVKSIEFVSYEDRENDIAPFSSCKIQFSKNELDLWSGDVHTCPQRKNPRGIVVLRIDLVQKDAGRIRVSFNYSSQLLVFSEIKLNTEKTSSVENLEASKSMCQQASFKVVAGGNKSSSSLTLILVLIIVLLVIIIIIVLAYRCRQKIAAKISGRKHGTLVETKHGLNGNNDQLAVKFTANPNYDTPERDDVEHMYAEVKEGPEHDEKRPFLPNIDHSIMLQEQPSAVENDEFYESTYAAPDEPVVGYTEVDVSPNDEDEIPDYSVPDLGPQDDNVELNPIYEGAKIYEDPYQTVTGSSLYADPTVEKERRSIEIKKFPRNRLHFLEKIGAGQFGEVHICEVESLGSIIGRENLECDWLMSRNVKVAVKLLKEGVEKCVEKEFMKEVRVMARLQHENVVQLLGVCDEEPKCMVVEYMENGDLNQFLKRFNRPNMDQPYEDQPDALNEETILHICMQIAAGMKYLASQGFIHRDLATRNCLVGHSFTVKISDFGMSRYLYSKQYYKIEGRAVLPIRWMAPESLFYGTFTSQTDVWAFGVTLWEVFTFARDTPYEHLSDQQVIDNACSVVAKQRKSFRCLPQPQGCPNNVYNILLSCWERSPADRPSFDELCRFFQGMVNTTEECI